LPSVLRTRRRLPISATTYNVRATKPELSSLARTEATTSFRFFVVPSFLAFYTRLLMQERGHEASRATPVRTNPGAGSSCLRRFARPRCWPARLTSESLRPRSSVRIDEHESKDRVKDASPDRKGREAPVRRVPTHAERRADDVPLLGSPSDIRCRRCVGPQGGTLQTGRTDQDLRSNGTPRREPSSGRPGRLPPPRRRVRAKRSLSSMTRDGLSLTPPHVSPSYWGPCFGWALQGSQYGRPWAAT
jgi:hypothetical protein